MTPITQYRANDGTIFTTEAKALAHESMLARIEDAMEPLGKKPKKVEDGKGWCQHSELAYRTVHRAIIKLARPQFKGFDELYALAASNPDKCHPMGLAGRIIGDSDSPLDGAFGRLSCIDAKFREHQQPYFAINGPDKEHVCVEDRS